MTGNNKEKALALTRLGFPVFKARLDADGTKTPLHKHGHLDATTDPGLVDDWFTEAPNAHVGVYVGGAGLVVLDIDRKNGKDGFTTLEEAWLEVPDTFSYDTPSGGRHLVYRAPAGVPLAPTARYRGMDGVDTRGGSSWVLWNGDVPASIDELAPAPEWLCDPVKVRSSEAFEGDLADWFENLVPGEPNAAVRKSIEKIRDDMSHSEMISAQHHAIRLGSEGNPGVPDLLAALEDAWTSRPAENHTTPEDEWAWKFAEGLASGVEKAGAMIAVLRDAPAWSLTLVPESISDSLVVGQPGTREDFSRLVNALVKEEVPELTAFSILWNSPVTKELSREWGAEFTYKRLQEAKTKPEPERENPHLEAQEAVQELQVSAGTGTGLLTEQERASAKLYPTFIDSYRELSKKAKGFVNATYATPLAWNALSMAVGHSVVIPRSGAMGVNLWFNVFGYSGSGKTKEMEFTREVLNKLFSGQDTYYNLGANSSPEGLHISLLERDKKASVILEDEAATFFQNLVVKDWMSTLAQNTSDWYNGSVSPSNKVRLKELKGKSAETSFHICMVSTPDKTIRHLSDEMFGTGFLARMNWVWGEAPKDNSHRYKSTRSSTTDQGIPRQVLDVAQDLVGLGQTFDSEERQVIWASDEAMDRMDTAYAEMDRRARLDPKYGDVLEPSITRLAETLWKCAALLAVYRGADQIEMVDVLPALVYVEEWYETLYRVSGVVTSAFKRDCDEIAHYIEEQGGSTSRERIMARFIGMITKNKREIEDRVDFLVESGRINRKTEGQKIVYVMNGG